MSLHDHFLLGPDLLVAPVHRAETTIWPVVLPAGADWTHVWTGESWKGGQEVAIAAPIGSPPVFFREGSKFTELFSELRVRGDL